jgi:hypothetical protein
MWRAALLIAALMPAPPARAESCFDGQLPGGPADAAWAETAARAAVRLVAALPDGRPFANASGIVVAGSGPPNRIVTAAHVVRVLSERRGAWLAVFSSRGVYLGRAQLAAQAAPGPAFGLANNGDAAGLRFGDAAVIEIVAFAPGAAAVYAGIAGVPLAHAQPRGLLEGMFAAPAGVDHGVSGSGVVAEGGLVGVMAFKALDPSMPLVAVTGGDAAHQLPPGAAAHRRTVRLPRQSVGYAQPMLDTALLAGLGAAGRAVGSRRAAGPVAVFVPGFVKDACVGFRGLMRPA